jgi:hypothetical protein
MYRLILLCTLLISCGKPTSNLSHKPNSEYDNNIFLEEIQLDISQTELSLNPAGSISLTELLPLQKVTQNLVIENNGTESKPITINSSSLSKVNLVSNCPAELEIRKKCSVIFSYTHSDSDIALNLQVENVVINGLNIPIEFSSKDFPQINNKVSVSQEILDFGILSSPMTKRIIVKNNSLHGEMLDLDYQNLGNFSIVKNTCPIAPAKLRSRISCVIDVRYSAINDSSPQTASIVIEDKIVQIKVNQSQGSGLEWNIFLPDNVIPYGSNGGLITLSDSQNATWQNGAYGSAISGDFVLEYNFTSLASGYTTGDIMAGYNHSIPVIGVYPYMMIYADQGSSLSPFTSPFVNSYSGSIPNAGQGQTWSLTFSRVGNVVSWTVVLPSGTSTGIAEYYSDLVYPYVLIYSNGTRLDSATISQ